MYCRVVFCAENLVEIVYVSYHTVLDNVLPLEHNERTRNLRYCCYLRFWLHEIEVG